MNHKPLGRRTPPDFSHVARYGLAELALPVPPAGTEKNLGLPWWWKQSDQGNIGSCVGWGCSHMMSVTNHRQRLLATGSDVSFRYWPIWLYEQAQLIDDWPETPPEEGTSVRAGCDILRTVGHRRVQRNTAGPPNLANGIAANRWATTVDEIRAAIYSDVACAIGVNWYSSFFDPAVVDGERVLKITPQAYVAGGHCVCLYRMSDRRQAFAFFNSWGAQYPSTWIPYEVMERLLTEDGEAVVISDR